MFYIILLTDIFLSQLRIELGKLKINQCIDYRIHFLSDIYLPENSYSLHLY